MLGVIFKGVDLEVYVRYLVGDHQQVIASSHLKWERGAGGRNFCSLAKHW